VKIATRIRLVACGLVVATALSVAFVEYWGYDRLVRSQQRESLENLVSTEGSKLEAAVAAVASDARLLAGLPATEGVVEARLRGDAAAETEWKDDMATIFSELLRTHPVYSHVRLLGIADNAREIVRVNRGPSGPRRVPEAELQQKGSSARVREAIQSPRGSVYVSEVTLNLEQGRIEVPHRAMQRVGVPVDTRSGERFGIIIINVDFWKLLDELYPSRVGRYAYYLTNAEGDYLLHPDAALSFGFELGARHRVQQDFPELAAAFDSAPRAAFSVRTATDGPGGGRLLSVRRLFSESPQPLALAISASYDDVAEQTLQVGWGALALTGALLLLAGLATWLVASVVTAPVGRITSALRDFAEGGGTPQLPVERRDELGVLARVFDRTLGAVRERESQILATSLKLQEANADLEHFAHIASHDLREPARRLAGLADAMLEREAGNVSSEGGALLRRMHDAAAKMLDQITDFRALTGIGHGALLRSDTDLTALVRVVLEEHAEAIEARRVGVEIGELPRLAVYESLVRVLYGNLVSNALVHASPGAFTLAFTAERDRGDWVLGVRNTGSEIRSQDLKRIFAPFTRLHGDAEGSGLGLSICKRIAERHSGAIWAESGTGWVHIRFTLGGQGDGRP
jgi:signal transduction histidine kinase